MVSIPKRATQPTVEAIYRHYEDTREPARGHLGCSLIGRQCRRELWYSFHWVKAPDFCGRVLRLFQRGQNEEKVFEDELRAVGVEVQTVDPTTGKQFKVSTHGGHFSGSMDGKALGILEAPKTWHVLEFKTHGSKSFADLLKKGVEKSKPEHYAQMQVYMRLGKLTRAFYLAVNKDTDDLYSERVHLDKAFADELIAKAGEIIASPVPPERISNDPSWYKCKWCDDSDLCHGSAVFPQTNCRTCAHSTPVVTGDADWTCARNDNDVIPFEFQRTGCEEHVFNPALVNATLAAGNTDENWTEYQAKDGRVFRNGSDHYSSKELSTIGLDALEEVAQAVKKPSWGNG